MLSAQASIAGARERRTLKTRGWGDLWARVARDTGIVKDACTKAMMLDHHDWVRYAANDMRTSPDALWRAMCAEWSQNLPAAEADKVIKPILSALP